MAVMWPRELPLSVRSDWRRQAEVRTYERLRAELDDHFSVFYSRPWLGLDRHGAERDGECDMLVAHPRFGFLALEIKGGGISYVPEQDQWKSRDRNGFTHNIKDPVRQSLRAMHEFAKRLDDSGRWRTRKAHMAHGVILTDAASPPRDLGLDKPAHIFCCAREFREDLRGWIGRRLCEGRQPHDCEPLGRDGIAAFEHLLAQPFQLHFPVSALMADAAERMGVLEPEQFFILDNIADMPRAEIRGGAGTGKTVIAGEEAVRRAAEGRRTLLTCHSAPLAAELERRLQSVPNLTVASFHSLCGIMAARAGLQPKGSGARFYEETLPDALADAARQLPQERYEVVIVDEGQDFRPNWWVALSEVLGSNALLRVMSDANQRVYDTGRIPGSDLELVPIRLTRNLRNTGPICAAASVHYAGPEIRAVGPDRPEVTWVAAEGSEKLLRAIVMELRRLVHTEEVAPSDIAVLVPDTTWVDLVREAAAASRLEFADAADLQSDAVVLDTVRRFKGLERPAVILVAAASDMRETELAYVGFTRPRTYLAVLSSAADQNWLRNGIAATASACSASVTSA